MFKFYFDIVFMKTVYLIFERFFNLDDDVIFLIFNYSWLFFENKDF